MCSDYSVATCCTHVLSSILLFGTTNFGLIDTDLRRHLLTTYLLLWFLNDFTKFTKHWNGLGDVEGDQSGLGPKTESYLHHLSLDRNATLFLKAAKKA